MLGYLFCFLCRLRGAVQYDDEGVETLDVASNHHDCVGSSVWMHSQ